jgi:hypothetical protein
MALGVPVRRRLSPPDQRQGIAHHRLAVRFGEAASSYMRRRAATYSAMSAILVAMAQYRRPCLPGDGRQSPICLPHCLPRGLFSGHAAAGNFQEVIAAQREAPRMADSLSALPPKADIAERARHVPKAEVASGANLTRIVPSSALTDAIVTE